MSRRAGASRCPCMHMQQRCMCMYMHEQRCTEQQQPGQPPRSIGRKSGMPLVVEATEQSLDQGIPCSTGGGVYGCKYEC